jgi:hypothetical protein
MTRDTGTAYTSEVPVNSGIRVSQSVVVCVVFYR